MEKTLHQPPPFWWQALRHQWQQELDSILTFWSTQMTDEVHGGFLGRRMANGQADPLSPKGAVLNARILWTFATAAQLQEREEWRQVAIRAYNELRHRFIDQQYGGVYWSITCDGLPYQTRKQTYAQAFAIYGFAAYYQLTADPDALKQACALYQLLEQNAADHKHGGYVEAMDEQWQPLEDMRLSEKDANLPKTMNTHLHVLEAYTLLYKVWPDASLANAIHSLLLLFLHRILQPETGTQGLFFSMDWQRRDTLVSFGHDIEAAWLLNEAAAVRDDAGLQGEIKNWSLTLVNKACQGIDKDGGMWNEYDLQTNHWVREKHWWPQAEAMVGFCDAWQNTGDLQYLDRCRQSWQFIQHYILQPSLGEWKWGVDAQGSSLENEDLAGFWKCPYHNARALMELLHRL
ncbi:MAG TPA: AGE family epimerase/isomerase [Phnomibacter sp.]|nr:AGE family epimerase/isomerase [Phnomibacter sp.]